MADVEELPAAVPENLASLSRIIAPPINFWETSLFV
jgi:hypothetical protein